MAVTFEQRIDLRKIAPTKWRLIGYLGQAVFFYAESGTEQAEFSVNSEFAQGDVGSWRAIDTRRNLVIGFGGRAVVTPKADGKPGEVNVTFNGVQLAI
jgi:hypothetical protein